MPKIVFKYGYMESEQIHARVDSHYIPYHVTRIK